MKKLFVIVGVILALSFVTDLSYAGYSSRGGGGFSSSRSYSSPSRSYSSPSRSAGSYSSPKPVYRSPPSVTRPSTTYSAPSRIVRGPAIVEHHYYGGGYGGGVLSNPFFWLWATSPHGGYGGVGYGGGYGAPIAGGGVQGPGEVIVYPPTPIWITLVGWLIILSVIGLLIWGLCAVWRWSERL